MTQTQCLAPVVLHGPSAPGSCFRWLTGPVKIAGAVQALHARLDPGQLLQVANGAVVGLIAGEPGAPLQQQPSQGLGIRRAVDPRRGLLYLLTPLPAKQLQQVQPDSTDPAPKAHDVWCKLQADHVPVLKAWCIHNTEWPLPFS